jgi:hypothetical protein
MLRPAFSQLAALALVAVAAAAACTNATGQVEGGELLVADPCGPDAPPTWTTLYTCYFGPSGTASCGSLAACHQNAAGLGAMTGGFVCGSSKESCFQGMTQGIAPAAGGVFCPIVCLGTCPQNGEACPSDPTKQLLLGDIHKAGGGGLDNMPCGGNLIVCPSGSATYTFTSDDITRITTWIQQGAQDN